MRIRTFSKAGDREQGRAWDRRSKRRAQVGRRRSPEMSEERMSQGRGVSSLTSPRKGQPRRQVRGLAQDEPPLPVSPLVASLVGTLRVYEMQDSGKKGGRAPGGRASLRTFYRFNNIKPALNSWNQVE